MSNKTKDSQKTTTPQTMTERANYLEQLVIVQQYAAIGLLLGKGEEGLEPDVLDIMAIFGFLERTKDVILEGNFAYKHQ